MNSNILYNEKNDNLYILLYQLGQGAFSTVWFSYEICNFMKDVIRKKINTNNIIINVRALKIHKDDSYKEGILETKINDILQFNKTKSNLINYPLSFFIEDDIVIIVYELALGSLYDILKKFNRDLDPDFILKIIPDMIESIKFIHNCGYIHTDIKPENFLLMGISEKQQNLFTYIKKNKLLDNFKKLSSNKKYNDLYENIKKYIYNFLNDISSKFKLVDNILEDYNESTNSEDSNDSEDSEDSEDSNNSDNTNCSSYDSDFEEYNQELDIFHVQKILKLLNNSKIHKEDYNEDNNEDNKDNKNHKEELYNLKSYMTKPIIKLTDFGCIVKNDSECKTIQTRYYRSPEIILGLNYNYKADIWSLGCSIYELLTGKILVNIDHDDKINDYDKDLINIKIILEKICNNKNDINHLCFLIKESQRSSYIINNNFLPISIRFYKNINNNSIITEISNLQKLEKFQVEIYKKYFNSMLLISVKDRSFS